jgi:hypothetical protein
MPCKPPPTPNPHPPWLPVCSPCSALDTLPLFIARFYPAPRVPRDLAVAGAAEHPQKFFGHHGALPRLQRVHVINGEVGRAAASLAPRVFTPHLSAQAPPCRVSVGLRATLPLPLSRDLIGTGAAPIADALQHATGQAGAGKPKRHGV